jgi:hypothetical protein
MGEKVLDGPAVTPDTILQVPLPGDGRRHREKGVMLAADAVKQLRFGAEPHRQLLR